MAGASDSPGELARQAVDDLWATVIDVLVRPQAVLVVVALGLWFVILQAVLAVTRPAGMAAAAATQDLGGEEPPAVVSLLANRWRVTVDAVESTMLDLAARRFVELRQHGDDPRQTTIHLLPEDAPRKGPAQLTAYERMVLDRVRRLARNDMLPITALTFRDQGDAHHWSKQFEERVRDDARRAGLSRPRLSGWAKRLLSVAALLPAGAAALLVWSVGAATDDRTGAGWGAAFITWGAVSAWGARYRGERDTPAGRAAAARWAGLRRWLENDTAFQALPPAGVAVWDRYLPYGTALGVNHVCSAVLDLGMGDRDHVWSSFGGEWHRVRVRYPRFWGRYGRTAPRLCLTGLISGAVGVLVLRQFSHVDLMVVLGVLLLARAAYQFARVIVDLLAPRELTGEVLWVQVWRQTKGKGEDAPPVPWLYWFAVDDGTSERTRAWGLPAPLVHSARPTDTVTMTVRPWSRRVLTVQVVPAPAGAPGPAVPPASPAPTPPLPPPVVPAPPIPAPPVAPLLPPAVQPVVPPVPPLWGTPPA